MRQFRLRFTVPAERKLGLLNARKMAPCVRRSLASNTPSGPGRGASTRCQRPRTRRSIITEPAGALPQARQLTRIPGAIIVGQTTTNGNLYAVTAGFGAPSSPNSPDWYVER
jgi:hypothetical protein